MNKNTEWKKRRELKLNEVDNRCRLESFLERYAWPQMDLAEVKSRIKKINQSSNYALSATHKLVLNRDETRSGAEAVLLLGKEVMGKLICS